jgi:uncharacterized protein
MSDVKAFQEHVKTGDLEAVRAALAVDPSLLDAQNETGQSAFLLAKYYRQQQMADYLLSLGPKLDVFQNCVAGRTGAALEEIDRQPDLLAAHNSDGWTPLHLAVFFGHTELAKGLLNRGAALEARSTNNMANTPLHAAAAGGNLAVIRVLLEHGADVNARQHGGWTALHAAAQAGNRAMVELLLAHSADREARAENNQTPLDLALLNGHTEVVSLLERRPF